MNDRKPLSTLRHSAAHILAQAVIKLFPEVKLGIGPAIEDGFYYDFDLPRTLNPDDLKKIEKIMKEIVSAKQPFERMVKNKEDTKKILKEQQQDYKLELVKELHLNEYIFYKNGKYIDLCEGPHVENTKEIKAFKLLRVAGAYWRGDERNKMLQRIYGTVFYTKDDLYQYLTHLEEAKKRDHRVLGKELDLFSTSEEVGPGLILWHPKGSRIRNVIEEYWKKEHIKNGYELIYTPHIGKSNLWKTSGHLSFYNENMFSAMDIDKIAYYTRPMNCPFHILIYNHKLRSYRDLPYRTAELGTVYRYEKTGVLHGLMRVRGFTQDDAHIFCSEEQVKDEIKKIMIFCIKMLKTFGFEKYKIFLSTKPEEKFVGTEQNWKKAETALKETIIEMKIPYEVDEGGGAFYGPKIDLKIEDAMGRFWQCSTIQFDFNLPESFDLSYTGKDGKKHRPYMIHRALLGAIERFVGVLIEHYGGKFPLWLSPIQVKIIGINEQTHAYCIDLKKAMLESEIRVETDLSNEKLGYKIRTAQKEKVPYMLVIGNKETENKTISVRSRDKGDLGECPLESFFELIKNEEAAEKNQK